VAILMFAPTAALEFGLRPYPVEAHVLPLNPDASEVLTSLGVIESIRRLRAPL